jgi:hypothetical protein
MSDKAPSQGSIGGKEHLAQGPGGIYAQSGTDLRGVSGLGADKFTGGARGTGGGDAAAGGTDHIKPIAGSLQADPSVQSRSSTAPEGWQSTDAGKR